MTQQRSTTFSTKIKEIKKNKLKKGNHTALNSIQSIEKLKDGKEIIKKTRKRKNNSLVDLQIITSEPKRKKRKKEESKKQNSEKIKENQEQSEDKGNKTPPTVSEVFKGPVPFSNIKKQYDKAKIERSEEKFGAIIRGLRENNDEIFKFGDF